MEDSNPTRQMLRQLFQSQMFAVLATHAEQSPYTNLVGFVATEDLHDLVFATDRRTRKYANLSATPDVAMLIDNRSNQAVDIQQAMAVTALGRAVEVATSEHAAWKLLYLRKHPHMAEFINTQSCALIRITVTRYYVVTRFQQVVELLMPE